MEFNSEPSEVPRKTLDDIRRELDAEYGCADNTVRRPQAREFAGDANGRTAKHRREPDGADHWTDADRADEAAVDFGRRYSRELVRAHHVATGRPGGDGKRTVVRRSGYLVAALLGCVAGQLMLLAFLVLMRYGSVPDLLPTSLASRGESTTAAAPIAPAAQEAQASPETRPDSGEPAEAPPSPPSSSPASLTPSQESRQASAELPPAAPQEPASSARPPAIVSSATARESIPSRVDQESRPATPGMPHVGGEQDLSKARARLRAALGEWLRTSGNTGAPVQTTEPVIMLSPDGRSAKTRFAVASPIGLIPREQRWTLGLRGWTLIDDRQAGLPVPGTASGPLRNSP